MSQWQSRQPYREPWPPPPSSPQPPRRRPWRVRSLLRWLVIGLVIGTGIVVAGQLLAPHGAQPAASAPAAPAGHPACAAYKALDSRGWLVIARDPDAHKGECVIVHGTVVQADAITGPHAVRALVGGPAGDPTMGILEYPTNVIISDGNAGVGSLVEGDAFTMRVYVDGALSYGNTFGGVTGTLRLLADSVTRS